MEVESFGEVLLDTISDRRVKEDGGDDEGHGGSSEPRAVLVKFCVGVLDINEVFVFGAVNFTGGVIWRRFARNNDLVVVVGVGENANLF